MQLKRESREKDPLTAQLNDIIYTLTASNFSIRFLIHFPIKLKQTICGNQLTFPLTFDL
jgi:hypothetical protein